jgi:hypothetical protein
MTQTQDEMQVRDALSRAMADVTAPTTRITTAAVAAGRRTRRRRRVAVGVTAAALVALAAGTLPQALGGGAGADAGYAGGPTAGVDPPPAEEAHLPGWWSMPAGRMVRVLEARLPDGMRLTDPVTTNTDRAPGEKLHELEGYLIATLVPRASGPGKVNVVLTPPPPEPTPVEEQLACAPDRVADGATCRLLHDGSGRVVGQVVDATVGGVRSLAVTVPGDDGGLVMVNVANTLDAKWPDGATPSSDRLPLSPARVRALAEDPAWTAYRP